jgi:hypothetical protein
VKIKVLVFCTNASGTPDIYRTERTVSEDQYEQGQHYYDAAMEAALKGYEEPWVFVDAQDVRGMDIEEAVKWLKDGAQ